MSYCDLGRGWGLASEYATGFQIYGLPSLGPLRNGDPTITCMSSMCASYPMWTIQIFLNQWCEPTGDLESWIMEIDHKVDHTYIEKETGKFLKLTLKLFYFRNLTL